MWFLPVFSEDCFGCSGPLAIPYEFEDRTAVSHFWKKSCQHFSRDGAEAVDCSGACCRPRDAQSAFHGHEMAQAVFLPQRSLLSVVRCLTSLVKFMLELNSAGESGHLVCASC